jgi:hypothetical protein
MAEEIIEETTKGRGAPLGNQNARTHGFYSKVLDEEQQREYTQATEVEGLDSEIALLRVKIKSLVARDPENIDLITQGTNALACLTMTKHNINKTDKQGLREAISNVLKDVALPLGIGLGSIFKK